MTSADPAAPRAWSPDASTIEILRVLSTGASMAETAARCHVSDRTLRRKLREAERGWGTTTVLATVVRAVREGFV